MIVLLVIFFGACIFLMVNYYPTTGKSQINPLKVFKVKHEFHVKVQCFGERQEKWIVLFTNNNWLTERKINTAFDITPIMGKVWVCHQEHLFKSQQEAIAFAKTMTTFEKCEEYNLMIKARYEAYIQYWKNNPLPPIEEKPKPKKEECTDIHIL